MKILISGAGIAGLTLAAFLKKQGHDPVVIEKAPKLRNMGFGIAMWDKGRRILEKLGIDDALAQKGYKVPSYEITDMQGKLLKEIRFDDYFSEYKPILIVTRKDLHELVAQSAKGVKIRFGTTLEIMKEQDSSVKVVFSDGTQEDFDLVVGADGVYSNVRKHMFEKARLQSYGWTTIMFWLPEKVEPPKGVFRTLGHDRQFAIFPMKEKSVVTCDVHHSLQKSENKTPLQNLRKYFADFGGIVNETMKHLSQADEIFEWNLMKVPDLKCRKHRAVLIGDAYHAISPLMGMGASLALEDSFVLSECLKKEGSIFDALNEYEKNRLECLKTVHAEDAKMWRWSYPRTHFFSVLRNKIVPFVPTEYFMGSMQRILKTSG